MRRFVACVAAAGLLLTACGDSSDPAVAPAPSDPEAPVTDATDDLGAKPDFEVDTSAEPPTALVVEDLVEGDGAEATAGSYITVHYVGKALSTGAEFDSSWDRGTTFDLTLGVGDVIAGWDQGFAGMREGGRRKLTIPPDLAYGDRSPGAGIGPNETLVFVVDLINVIPPIDKTKPEFEVDTSAEPPADLIIEDLEVGDGEEAVAGSTVIVHYVGKSLSTGVEFDSSWDRGSYFDFPLGAGRVIQGWDLGVEGMRVGGRRMLTIPGDLAYGPERRSEDIGPNETLIFVIDLVDVR